MSPGCLLLFWFFIELVVAIWKRCVEQELLVVGVHITLALQCLSCYFCRLPGSYAVKRLKTIEDPCVACLAQTCLRWVWWL